MIILGYPGIGKSTIADACHAIIDLESSNFVINDQKVENWHKIYAKLAVDLSCQGYIVLCSTHKDIQDAIAEIAGNIFKAIIYPSLELKDRWIQRLEHRFIHNTTDKNHRALTRAKQHYEADINALINDGRYVHFEITDINNYDLYDLIDIVRNN